MSAGPGEHWSLHAGDPSLLGWIVAFAYFAAALLAWRTSRSTVLSLASSRPARLAHCWVAIALLLVLLGLNKQLDLQTGIGAWGKQFALDQGWYEQKRLLQQAFFALLSLGALLAIVAALWYLQGIWRPLALALCGLALLIGYALARAAVVLVLREDTPPVLNWFLPLLEVTGLSLVAWQAWRAARPLPSLRA